MSNLVTGFLWAVFLWAFVCLVAGTLAAWRLIVGPPLQ